MGLATGILVVFKARNLAYMASNAIPASKIDISIIIIREKSATHKILKSFAIIKKMRENGYEQIKVIKL